MTDDQLLQALQAQGLLDVAGVSRLRRDALIADDSVESVIWKQRLIPDEKVAEVKSAILKVPYKKIDAATINEALFQIIPEETARSYATVPLSSENDLLVIGMVHPDDLKAQDAVKFIARQAHVSLGVYLISYGDWQEVLKKYSPYRTEIAAAVQALNIKPGETGASSQNMVSIDTVKSGEDAPVIRIVADTFREALQSKASDIHIEPQEKYLRIRFRIDGDLHQVASLPLELAQPVTSRVKVISNLKIDETRIPQDGRFRAKIFDKDIDFRIATFPTPLGEKIAIRVLDPATGLKNFDNLPFLYKNADIVKAGLEKPFGMILITGPTGSGKTTTLYSILQKLNQEDVNIVSLEDPVEYFVSGINQSQVHPEIGYDFASGLRQILRQDPDIIMVGEVRDNETAGLAVQAALTGHIVLSTLHTNNAAGVIPRLIDMKVEAFLIPVSLNLIIAQRLIGVLCPDCKVKEPASPQLEEVITRSLADLPAEILEKYHAPYQVYHSKGCATCKGRGILGRSGIYEVFRMTPEIEGIVSSGPTAQKIMAEAKRQGMITLRQDGLIKALEGVHSAEEIIRETEEA